MRHITAVPDPGLSLCRMISDKWELDKRVLSHQPPEIAALSVSCPHRQCSTTRTSLEARRRPQPSRSRSSSSATMLAPCHVRVLLPSLEQLTRHGGTKENLWLKTASTRPCERRHPFTPGFGSRLGESHVSPRNTRSRFEETASVDLGCPGQCKLNLATLGSILVGCISWQREIETRRGKASSDDDCSRGLHLDEGG